MIEKPPHVELPKPPAGEGHGTNGSHHPSEEGAQE